MLGRPHHGPEWDATCALPNITAGTEAGARVEAAGQDGTPCGIAWLRAVHDDRKTAFRSAFARSAAVLQEYMGA